MNGKINTWKNEYLGKLIPLKKQIFKMAVFLERSKGKNFRGDYSTSKIVCRMIRLKYSQSWS